MYSAHEPFAARMAGRTPGRAIGGGQTFFVGGTNANDAHTGNDPQFPMNTIAAAMVKCASGRWDVIYVQDYWLNDTFPVVINKHTVSVIGIGQGNIAAEWPVMNGAGTAIFHIGGAAGGYFEIAGLTMYSAGGPCIEGLAGGEGRGRIHNCAFGVSGAAQDGILIAAMEVPHMTFDNNLCGQFLTRDGIRSTGPNCTKWHIDDNLFQQMAGVGINISAGDGASIFNNRFYQKVAPAQGFAITLANCRNFHVDGNRAAEDGGHAGANPYEDTSTGTDTSTTNGWGVNYHGNIVTYPAFA